MKSLARLFIIWMVAMVASAGGTIFTGSHGLVLTLSPPEAMSGLSVQAGRTTAMTLGVHALPGNTYAVRATADGGVGACAVANGSVTTDGSGVGSWTCDFTAGSEPASGALTFTVSWDARDLGYLRVLVTVEPAPAPAPEPTPVVEQPDTDVATESADNHGGCVSYWAHRSKAEGLRGGARGAFTSWIANSDCTTSTREDAEYVSAFEQALAEQEAETTDEGGARGKHRKAKDG